MELEKICRTCMGFSGPLMSIYDGETASGIASCIAEMLTDVTKIKPKKGDNLPEKVCLTCISEINRCYSYKMKVENSNRTLRQLIPDALPEELEINDGPQLTFATKGIQVMMEKPKCFSSIETQTDISDLLDDPVIEVETRHNEKPQVSNLLAGGGIDIKSIKKEENPQNSIKMPPTIFSIKKFLHREEVNRERKKLKTDLPGHYEEVESQEIEVIQESDHRNEQNYLDPNSYEVYEEYVMVEGDPIPKEAQADYHHQQQSAEMPEDEDYMKLCTDVEDVEEEEENQIELNISFCNETDEAKALKDDMAYKPTKYQCANCVMSFVSIKNLNKHFNKRHCVTIAPSNFENNDDTNNSQDIEIIKEFKRVKSNGPYKPGNSPLKPQPMILRTEPKPMQHTCENCHATFALQKSLLYHYRLKACSRQSFHCRECGRVFISEESLEEHKSTHVLSNNCNECSKVFPTKEELSQHMVDAHNRKVKNQCNICLKVFTMHSTLKDHMRIHTGEKPFICPICKKGFTQNANLKQHILRHGDNKPFKCDECSKSYCTRAEYYSHKRTHTGDQPFRCEFCDARFTTNSSMTKHRRKHTGERPYACDICPMRFASSNVLKNHRRTHTGEKPFKCIFCPKVFVQKGDCQNHQSTHLQFPEKFEKQPNRPRAPPPRPLLQQSSGQIAKQEFPSEEDYQQLSVDDQEDTTQVVHDKDLVLMEIDVD